MTNKLKYGWHKSKGDDEMNFNDDFNDNFNNIEKQVKKTFKWSVIAAFSGAGISLVYIGAVIWILVKAIA